MTLGALAGVGVAFASTTSGEVGFGIFVAASVVLIVFVVRFAVRLGRRGRN